MEARSPDASIVFHPIRIADSTGFFHQIAERPVVLILVSAGRQAMLVPKLEQEHIASIPGIDRVSAYPEYPAVARSTRCVISGTCSTSPA